MCFDIFSKFYIFKNKNFNNRILKKISLLKSKNKLFPFLNNKKNNLNNKNSAKYKYQKSIVKYEKKDIYIYISRIYKN